MLRLILLAPLAVAGPLEEVFSPILEPAQLADLGPAPAAEALASAMRPEQKEVARSALEQSALPPQERARGLQLLDPIAAYRAEAEARGLLPTPAGELTAQASDALARGDNEAAARFAAEALARDPSEEKAFGILKLTERRVAAQAAVIEAASVMPASFARSPTPTAAALMSRTVAARRSGDLDRTLQSALDAMRADPTSPEVQELYKLVIADRAKEQLRVQKTLSLMEAAAQALKEGRATDADRLAAEGAKLDPSSSGYWTQLRRSVERQAGNGPAPKQKGPGVPLFPLTASLVLTAGAFAWHHWGRDKAGQLQRDAAILATAGGVAGFVYFGWLALPTAGLGGPALAPVGGPALSAMQLAAQKAVGLKLALGGGVAAGIAAHQALPKDGYSYSKHEPQDPTGQTKPDRVMELLRPNGKPIGTSGSSPHVRIVRGSVEDMKRLFEQLSAGGENAPKPGYSGTRVRLPDGRYVGMRLKSKHGPPTIDVQNLGVGFRKVKFVP